MTGVEGNCAKGEQAPTRVLRLQGLDEERLRRISVEREWLVTNGLGGYASGTLAGVATRRYHGLLIAALPPPLGRTVMLNQVSEELRLADGSRFRIAGTHRPGSPPELPGIEHLEELRLEQGLPVWRYRLGSAVLERRVVLVHGQNTLLLIHRLLEADGPVRLVMRPNVHFRSHDDPVDVPLAERYRLLAEDERLELSGGDDYPPLRLRLDADRAAFTFDRRHLEERLFQVEQSRGYASIGRAWSPGTFRCTIERGGSAALLASTEPWVDLENLTGSLAVEAERSRRSQLLAQSHPSTRRGIAAELVLAADQFVISPAARRDEVVAARARGDRQHTIIAGYHWFTDWGRDTMISLEGLTLVTGREADARDILLRFASHVRDGLVPNFFSEREGEGVYHTADASLWFFHAVDRFLEATDDETLLRRLMPTLESIVAAHLEGTRFGIGVDDDGLLRQGAEGYQLTWMDAKVDGWVVTPRRGKAVEINGLWYNALCLLADWRERLGTPDPDPLRRRAAAQRESFNQRFWSDALGYLYDVVDGETGDDPALRPNQLLSFSLRHPVLDEVHWSAVLQVVEDHLLTPVGLRSLAPSDPDYRSHYFGDLRARDAAYHQGTVWAWLIGPFLDAWRRVHPHRPAAARRHMEGLVAHLDDFCIGSLAEIYDGDPPHTPRGCIAQAWSVAEVLRCWAETEPESSSGSAR